MWHTVQLSPLACRADRAPRQSEVGWQPRHLLRKYVAFSFASGTEWGSWHVPHHSFSPLALLQALCARFSTWLVTRSGEGVPARTKTARESASTSPGRKSPSARPGLGTRISPERWHCPQMLSRRAPGSFAGFTIGSPVAM